MNDRHTTIVDMLREEQKVDISDLAKRFGVSQMTIRRDLALMERNGLLTRTRAGGMAVGKLRFIQGMASEENVSPRKVAIGKLAAEQIMPGQTIMVDAGVTALQVALHMPQDPSITIATTSLCIAQALYGSEVNLLLLGGFVRREFPSLCGPLTEKLLLDMHVDLLFIGCDGADSRTGFYTVDLNQSSLEQKMIEIADKVILVTESIKFGRKAFARYATPNQVDMLVTDAGLSPEDMANLEEQGVTVLIAK